MGIEIKERLRDASQYCKPLSNCKIEVENKNGLRDGPNYRDQERIERRKISGSREVEFRDRDRLNCTQTQKN